jgi:hypothetical protein
MGQYTRQKEQILALIQSYNQLGAAFEANVENLDPLKEGLGELHFLRGIELTDNKELLPTLINYAQQMGLTGGQVDNFLKRVLELIDILNDMNKIKAEAHVGVEVDVSQAVAALRYFNAILNATAAQIAASGFAGGGPSSFSAAASRTGDFSKLVDRLKKQQKRFDDAAKRANAILGRGRGSNFPGGGGGGGGGGGSSSGPSVSLLDIPDEFHDSQRTVGSLLKEAVKNARNLQSKIPGETKANRKEIVAILDGTKKVLQTRGVGEDYLRRAMEELAKQIQRQNDLLAKANGIRRIRVGGGDFSAIANLPVNTTSGISLAGQGNVNVTLNLNGTVLTPAQFSQFADQIAAALKKQLAS